MPTIRRKSDAGLSKSLSDVLNFTHYADYAGWTDWTHRYDASILVLCVTGIAPERERQEIFLKTWNCVWTPEPCSAAGQDYFAFEFVRALPVVIMAQLGQQDQCLRERMSPPRRGVTRQRAGFMQNPEMPITRGRFSPGRAVILDTPRHSSEDSDNVFKKSRLRPRRRST